MARFNVLTLTDKAVNRIKDIMQQNDAAGILIGIKKGGCAGMEYTIDLAKETISNVDVIDVNGAKVFVARDAVLFLLGTEMDFETTTLRTGFVFKNPNQVSACGCGESVEIQPASENSLQSARGVI